MPLALKIPPVMTVPEFLGWNQPIGPAWQLVDGIPLAMAPASRTHGAIQQELGSLLRNHLLDHGGPCSVIANPGIVPRLRAESNFRIPDLAVTCSPCQEEEYALTDPVLVIEILSPSNQAETWANVWAYATIPSVREILIVHSTAVAADLLRRDADGDWPDRPLRIEDDGVLDLQTVGFQAPVAALYRATRLAPPAAG
ncbi:MAG: Uma2 family endonuclease [Acetobacteraceae bacterium]